MGVFTFPIASAYGQNVRPAGGSKIYFFEAGTSTPKTSYKDSAETIAHTNPVVADGTGRFPLVYISGLYKIRLADMYDAQIWEEDYIQGAGSGVSYIGDFDSNTNGGNYPALGAQGDMYRVSTGFFLEALSGLHYVRTGDFIIANKPGATGIDADWGILRGVNTGVIGASYIFCGPVGQIPPGFLVEDGSTLDSVANPVYAQLFSVIGTTWGGTGADDFNLPNSEGLGVTFAGTQAISGRNKGGNSLGDTVEDQMQRFNRRYIKGPNASSNRIGPNDILYDQGSVSTIDDYILRSGGYTAPDRGVLGDPIALGTDAAPRISTGAHAETTISSIVKLSIIRYK